MKISIFAVILAAVSVQANASSFSVLQANSPSDIQLTAPSVSAPRDLVTKSAGSTKAENPNYLGNIIFIDWSVHSSSFESGAIVIQGLAAKTLYNTMTRARYRPEPANMGSMHMRDISRDICEARISRNMICLKIPVSTADGALLLSSGRPTYNNDSYQCDINIPNVKTMDFSVN